MTHLKDVSLYLFENKLNYFRLRNFHAKLYFSLAKLVLTLFSPFYGMTINMKYRRNVTEAAEPWFTIERGRLQPPSSKKATNWTKMHERVHSLKWRLQSVADPLKARERWRRRRGWRGERVRRLFRNAITRTSRVKFVLEPRAKTRVNIETPGL